MSEYIGATGAWQLHCTLSLASCRLRAETLARRLHSKLWAPGSRYENGAGANQRGEAAEGFYEHEEQLPDVKDSGHHRDSGVGTSGNTIYRSRYGGANAAFINIGTCWRDTATGAMFATAMANSSSLDDEEFYDPEGDFSPPSPVEETDEIIVNAPSSLTHRHHHPGMSTTYENYYEAEDGGEASEETKMLKSCKRSPSSSKMVTNNNEELYEKLAQIADSLNLSANSSEPRMACRKELGDIECDSGISSNGALFSSLVNCRDEPVVREPKPVNGELFDDESLEADFPPEVETPRCTQPEDEHDDIVLIKDEEDPNSPSVMVGGKFSVTPVLSTTDVSLSPSLPEVKVDKTPDVPDIDILSTSPSKESFKNSLSIDSNLSLDVDDEALLGERKVLLRSTSLKSGKTPPGTPRRKKIVRFADALGLDLEAVRHIVTDDIPNIPASAFTDLRLPKSEDILSAGSSTANAIVPTDSRVLYPQFSQPATDPFFLDRVRNHKVCLENVVINGLSLYGVVRVLNVCFEKTVLVRYTMDDWVNFYEVAAMYIPGSSDGFSDRFRFTLYQSGLGNGEKVTFAIRYLGGTQEFWDNNYGVNYSLRCHSTSPIVGQGGESTESPTWMYAYM